jgi:uncharacterized protein (DUF3084 family)
MSDMDILTRLKYLTGFTEDVCGSDIREAADELARLRAELAAEREGRQDAIRQIAKARDERDAIQQKADDEFASMSEQLNTFVCERVKIMAERDTLRAELAERDELLQGAMDKLQPISALVDTTPSGFPDHDICPIRLGMARDLRELRARIDALLAKGEQP